MTPPKNPSRADLLAAAEAVAADPPAAPGWPARGAMPAAKWVTYCRKAGWPVAAATVRLPHRHASGRVESSDEAVTVVPVEWLRAMAARLGVPWAAACRGVVEE